MDSHQSPIACDRFAFTGTARKRHFEELGPVLRQKVKNARELHDGYEFEFPSDAATFRLVAGWAADEHLCCPFFDINLRQERENGRFWLSLTGRPGVKTFIEMEFSHWIRK